MKHLKKFESVYSISDRLAPFLKMFEDLDMFEIRIVYNDHFVAKFKKDLKEEFQVFVDRDQNGEWLCIEYNTDRHSTVADPLELGTMQEMLQYMKNASSFTPAIKTIWKRLIEKDPTYVKDCPAEYLNEISPKFGKMKDIGLF
jgi:hypothetical protein